MIHSNKCNQWQPKNSTAKFVIVNLEFLYLKFKKLSQFKFVLKFVMKKYDVFNDFGTKLFLKNFG